AASGPRPATLEPRTPFYDLMPEPAADSPRSRRRSEARKPPRSKERTVHVDTHPRIHRHKGVAPHANRVALPESWAWPERVHPSPPSPAPESRLGATGPWRYTSA